VFLDGLGRCPNELGDPLIVVGLAASTNDCYENSS
jgi:hypothetical protein